MVFHNRLNKKELHEQPTLKKLQALMEEFCFNAARAGHRIRPYAGDGLSEIPRLNSAQQERALKLFTTFFEIFENAGNAGIPMVNNKEMLWTAIKSIGLRPCSDLLEHIDDSDIVEIYDTDAIQIFRNLEFFRVCSYTLDDLFTGRWQDLYQRKERDLAELASLAEHIYSGRVSSTIPSNLRVHHFVECHSPERYQITAQHKIVSPLFDQTQKNLVRALVISSEAEVTGRLTS